MLQILTDKELEAFSLQKSAYFKAIQMEEVKTFIHQVNENCIKSRYIYGASGISFYHPSPVIDLVTGNIKRGRICTKNNKNWNERYWFDHKGFVLKKQERNPLDHKNSYCSEQYYHYMDHYKRQIAIRISYQNQNFVDLPITIDGMTESRYDDTYKIIETYEINSVNSVSLERYAYENDRIYRSIQMEYHPCIDADDTFNKLICETIGMNQNSLSVCTGRLYEFYTEPNSNMLFSYKTENAEYKLLKKRNAGLCGYMLTYDHYF